jgi:hypothetical protein
VAAAHDRDVVRQQLERDHLRVRARENTSPHRTGTRRKYSGAARRCSLHPCTSGTRYRWALQCAAGGRAFSCCCGGTVVIGCSSCSQRRDTAPLGSGRGGASPGADVGESRRRCGAHRGADAGRVPAQMRGESRRRCGTGHLRVAFL